jgi:hypothetical protein
LVGNPDLHLMVMSFPDHRNFGLIYRDPTRGVIETAGSELCKRSLQ